MIQLEGRPLFGCAVRPFFLGGAAHGALLIPIWVLGLTGVLPLPLPQGGPLAWHAHEMIFGFATAALCGFLLTAVPSFTDTPAWHGRRLAVIFGFWLGGRVFGFLPGQWAGIGALSDLGLLIGLMVATLPALLPSRANRGFAYPLLALFGVALMLSGQRFLKGAPLLNPQLGFGLFQIFVILASRRIGMRLFQRALPTGSDRVFLPRPPAARIAIFSLVLVNVAEWAQLGGPVIGWLALAAGAAVFHVASDWHLGRTLFRTRILVFYLGLCCIALGYLGMGFSRLLEFPEWLGAFRHLSVMGGLGLPVFGVMCVAGRAHTGHDPDDRLWFPMAVGLLVLATACRVIYGLTFDRTWLVAAGLGWSGCFATYFCLYFKTHTQPGPGGEIGC